MAYDAVAGIYASQIISGFDLWKPEVLNDLFQAYGDQGMSYFQVIRSLGFEKPVAQDEYSHYEYGRIHETFKVGEDVIDPTVGEPAVIKLHADSFISGKWYPRLWDTVLFPTEVTGQIVAITDNGGGDVDITVEPNLSTDNIGALTDGDELAIVSSGFSEESGQPEGAVTKSYKYTNYAQTIKETVGVSGHELTRQTWIPITTWNGKKLSIPSYFNAALSIDLDYRMALKIDGALLVQKKTTNTTGVLDPDTGYPITTTHGLIPTIRDRGNVYQTGGAFAVDDLDAIDRILEKEHAGNNVLVLPGILRHQEMENALVTYFADTNINYAKDVQNEVLFGGNKSLAASVNFKSMVKSERLFNFKRMVSFSNPKYLGVANYPYEKLALFLPLNKKRDPRNGNLVESIGTRYRELGGYSRRMEIWRSGTLMEPRIGDLDKDHTYQRCHIGAHFRGVNAFVLMED